jgi:hypothetical protein
MIVIALFAGFSSMAQSADTTYWIKGGFGSLTFSQVKLSNWAGGGQESVSVNGIVNVFADYKRDRATWENSLDMGYGLLRQGDKKKGNKFIKSDDKVNLVSKFGYRVQKGNDNWFYSGLVDFKTQFDEGLAPGPTGKDSVISKALAPAYLTLGLGVDYKPNDVLSINYIPLTGKFTYVGLQRLADLGAYGVPVGKKARGEFGSYLRIKYKDDLFENVNLDSRLELFTNYVTGFGTIDVNWQNALVMKVNKFLTANLFAQVVYDKDIKEEKLVEKVTVMEEVGIQFKSVFGVGLSYSIGAQRKK